MHELRALFWEQVGVARPRFDVEDLGTERSCKAYYSVSADVPVVYC